MSMKRAMAKPTLFGWTKTLHLVRGLPGEGKSTLALQLVKGNPNQVVENDDYWLMPEPGQPMCYKIAFQQREDVLYDSQIRSKLSTKLTYQYERAMTDLAAYACYAEAFRRLRVYDEVAVANTFVTKWSLTGYIKEAKKLGVRVKLHRPKTRWIGKPETCFKKNIHGVPMETIQKMLRDWEEFTQDEVDELLGIAQ